MPAKKKLKAPSRSSGSGSSSSSGSSSGGNFDLELLRQLIDLLETSEVTHLAWKSGGEEIEIHRGALPADEQVRTGPVAVEVQPRPSAPVRSKSDNKGYLVTSPFVGTFYRTPSPDQAPYADVGTVVKKGQVLCIVEAMKLMNEIESEVAGKVVEVLAENAQPVEFGQPLFRIEPV